MKRRPWEIFPKCRREIDEESLESRVTNMIHEIGIPAHIKGYHYLRDAIMMAVEDMDVLNAITKNTVSDSGEEISYNIKQSRTCNSTCD